MDKIKNTPVQIALEHLHRSSFRPRATWLLINYHRNSDVFTRISSSKTGRQKLRLPSKLVKFLKEHLKQRNIPHTQNIEMYVLKFRSEKQTI